LLKLAFVLFATASLNAQVNRVVNAASFLEDDAISPGSIVSIFGQNLASATAQVADPANPATALGGVTVTAGGRTALLFYVSPRQINARLDPLTPTGTSVPLVVTSSAGTFNANIKVNATVTPGVFASNGAGTRDAAVLNAITFDRGPFSVTTNGQPTFIALFATGLNLSGPVTASIDGVASPVVFAGEAPCCKGLQQINIQLKPELAAAGRVDVTLTAAGKTSNVVEIVIVPAKGQGPHKPSDDHSEPSRHLASLAWVPGTSLVLLADENDDVVRVIDVKQKKTLQTIALPERSGPSAVAVANSSPPVAVVTEREDGKVALITGFNTASPVVKEIAVGSGPSAVAISGLIAIVVNQDSDSVSFINLTSQSVIGTVAVGRGPRAVAVDNTRAYVTNSAAGTISVLDIATRTVVATWNLGSDARPQSIAVIPGVGALVTEPTSHDSRVFLVNLTTGAATPVNDVNPDRKGGTSDIAVNAATNTIYLASQTGGSVIALRLSPTGQLVSATSIKADIGTRALTIDLLDRLLVATNPGSGTLVLIDLDTNRVTDRINGLRGPDEKDDDDLDNHDDRGRAANIPSITAVAPTSANGGSANVALTITGQKLTGATGIVFILPSSVPGNNKGKGKGRGPKVDPDTAFTVTNLQVNAAGTTATATISIAANAAKGDRIVRVLTPNGESSLALTTANTFRVN
jgi:uncharacterized protein (TIGR03437 family)